MKRPFLIIVSIVLLILLFALTAVWLAGRLDSDAPLSLFVIAVAAISFFGLLSLAGANERAFVFTDASLRLAIAGSVVIEYLVLVAVVAFFQKGPEELPPITQTIINSFTTIVGVVVAFYFGSSTIIMARRKAVGDADALRQ